MIQSAKTRLDGTTLVVRIPMRFQRRGGHGGSSPRTAAKSCRPPSTARRYPAPGARARLAMAEAA